ncbi:ABC transporter permease subunit [Pannus brasiliensis CCIBt3594]|uniref:ABC transporter permease subunit n=1 Tax=Pannus brasiliensis CCIBt3594 TaxID=1427578 RepID=A0AAW9QH95_9CHRO
MTRREKISLWYDDRFRKIFLQAIIFLIVFSILFYFGRNLVLNFRRLRLSFGFGFLFDRSASFSIGDSPIPFSPSDPYIRAVFVGLLNSLRVMISGIILSIALGVAIGLGRLSDNWLVRQLATVYVETIRNTPLLLQLFFWYFAVFLQLPKIDDPLQIGASIFISNAGIYLPFPANSLQTWLSLIIIIISLVAAWFLWRRESDRTSEKLVFIPVSIAIIALVFGLQWRVPRFDSIEQSIDSGLHLSSEFSTLLIGLTVYTAAFIAETVRAGIQSVSKGQWEAARAIGLQPGTITRLIVFPQALRVMIPPLTNECLNLAKNSSLAIAIGYTDIYAVSSTIANQTGKSVEMLIVVMATYLSFNLIVSLIMNRVNQRVKIPER